MWETALVQGMLEVQHRKTFIQEDWHYAYFKKPCGLFMCFLSESTDNFKCRRHARGKITLLTQKSADRLPVFSGFYGAHTSAPAWTCPKQGFIWHDLTNNVGEVRVGVAATELELKHLPSPLERKILQEKHRLKVTLHWFTIAIMCSSQLFPSVDPGSRNFGFISKSVKFTLARAATFRCTQLCLVCVSLFSWELC